MNIGIVGLGLIGGSLAKSIKQHTGHTVLGFDIDENVISQAEMCAAIDGVLTDENIGSCKVILIALYPGLCVDYIRKNADRFAPDTLVIDCAGVKRSVVEPAREIAKGHSWTYVGGHPMAGREFSGFGYAINNLFERASMIVVPPVGAPIELLSYLKDFFLSIGFKTIQFTSAEEHDSMISYTSQLAHIVSGAYVKNPLSQQHKNFSAGSFMDMTRVARLNENMWTELFLANNDLLVPQINDLIYRLEQYRDALKDCDAERLHDLLKEGRIMKEALDH
ncbi:MAG: prephenate dehydrogenase/arogenate dehydrogenase family protein [Clostridia bacterium]|nr:prephenate dehydrogenase/arogenate dehydrogenase family protein [Clostridia bacterium]